MINKYLYLRVTQMHTNHGWEDVTAEECPREARARLREYRSNDPDGTYRNIGRREVNPKHQAR